MLPALLPRMTAELDLRGVEAAIRDFERALDAELAAAMAAGAAAVADEAKRVHPFQNRTGDLENSIAPLPTQGNALAGTLEGGVVAAMPYASYVNDRPEFEFLMLAYNLTQAEFARGVDDALEAAARSAGLATG